MKDQVFRCACCNKLDKYPSGDYRSIYVPWNRYKLIARVGDCCKDNHLLPKISKKSGNRKYVGGSNTPCTMFFPNAEGKYHKVLTIREECKKK